MDTVSATEESPATARLVRELLDRVADKWTLLIIEALESGEPVRFTRLREAVGGVSQKMLTKTLRQLERDGLVTRRVHPVIPPHVDYTLTPMGRSLGEAVCGIWLWVEAHAESVGAARQAFAAREVAAPRVDDESRAVKLLALTGSLRARSINTELLRSLPLLAPTGVEIVFSEELGLLPHFNPDLDGDGSTPPPAVARLRAEVSAADALVISCPEYAHGIAGSFKNLLDWLVSSPAVVDKPVCVLSASSAARFGPEALVEVLRTMSARIVSGAAFTVPIDGRRLDAHGIAADDALARDVRGALTLVADVVSGPQT